MAAMRWLGSLLLMFQRAGWPGNALPFGSNGHALGVPTAVGAIHL